MTNSPIRVARSELSKLASLPSILLTVAATVVATVGLSYVSARSVRSALDRDSPLVIQPFTPELVGFFPLSYGQVGMIALGVLAMSSEYTGGQIRSSLAGVPSRGLLLGAKAAVIALVAALVAAPTTVASMIVAQAGLGPYGIALADMTGGPLWRAAGAVAYWALIALLAFGLTVLVRNAVVPLVVLISMSMALSFFLTMVTPLAAYLPDIAGAQMFIGDSADQGMLSPVVGGAVMAAWTLGLVAVGYVAFTRRDA